jgi:hypothetical protein
VPRYCPYFGSNNMTRLYGLGAPHNKDGQGAIKKRDGRRAGGIGIS